MITGSGPSGRITASDVESAIASRTVAIAEPKAAAAAVATPAVSKVPISREAPDGKLFILQLSWISLFGLV